MGFNHLNTRMMKYILVFSLAAFLFGGCIKTNYIDTGLADGNYDGTLLGYLESRPGTWDSAIVAIRHAGLESLFDGTSGEYPEGITFFGFTNHSVRNFLYETAMPCGSKCTIRCGKFRRMYAAAWCCSM